MHKNPFVYGLSIATSVALVTFLFVLQFQVGLRPFFVQFSPPPAAQGLSASLSSLCSNLQGYWKFDDALTSTTLDSSDNGSTSTLVNMSASNRSTEVPTLGFTNSGSATFNGSDEAVTVASTSALQITGNLTVSAWVYYTSLSTVSSGNVIVSHGKAGETLGDNMLYELSIRNNKNLRFAWETGTGALTEIDSSVPANINGSVWHHIAAVRDTTAKTLTFYVDGTALGTAQSYTSDANGGTDGTLSIGAGYAANRHYNGQLDDIRIYNTALTGGQISVLKAGTDVYYGCSCGNGVVESPETCDNGTANNSDTTADACRTNCRQASCGDGVVDAGESCDDGNTVDNDSCSNSCTASVCGDGTVQTGEECDDGASNSDSVANACRTNCKNPTCGDNVVDIGETCDTGGNSATCDSDCTAVSCGDSLVNSAAGEQCDAGGSNSDTIANSCRTNCKNASCGDGVTDSGESCDDGNGINNDSCTNSCAAATCGDGIVQAENGETCEPPGSNTCASNCTGVSGGGTSNKDKKQAVFGVIKRQDSGTDLEVGTDEERPDPPEGCGNRIFEPELGEECDEGNRNGLSACSYYCKVLYCGDGVVSAEIFEQCEPPIEAMEDGLPVFTEPTCGENSCSVPQVDRKTGRVTGGCQRLFLDPCEEEEDDSDEEDEATCGDGELQDSETCDDGNTKNNDGCSSKCQEEFCGDGVVQADEDCDNGSICSNNNSRFCQSNKDCGVSPECKEAASGELRCDGEIDGEPCSSDFDCVVFGSCNYDDNKDAMCSDSCTLDSSAKPSAPEPKPTANASDIIVCGNGEREDNEECDDGNRVNGDDCLATCQLPLDAAISQSLAEAVALNSTAWDPTGLLALSTLAPDSTALQAFKNAENESARNLYEALDEQRYQVELATMRRLLLLKAIAKYDSTIGTTVYREVIDAILSEVTEDDVFAQFDAIVQDATEAEEDLKKLIEPLLEGVDSDTLARGSTRFLQAQLVVDFTADPGERERYLAAFFLTELLAAEARIVATLEAEADSVLKQAAALLELLEQDQALFDAIAAVLSQEILANVSRVEVAAEPTTEPDEEPVFEPEPEPEPAAPEQPLAVCGNGIIEGDEACDQGDQNSDTTPNQCRTDCTLPICGDAIVDQGEECDTATGNSDTNPDACRLSCLLPYCGDGVVDSGEDCDGGILCDKACTFKLTVECGNGVLERGEECDDGNRDPGDGCSNLCQEEVSPIANPTPTLTSVTVCGNGVREGREECDDGNNTSGDGCSEQCSQEVALSQPAAQVLRFTQTDVKPSAPPTTVVKPARQPAAPLTATVQPWQAPYIPITPQRTVAGNTGPATAALFALGSAAGFVFRRKRS